MVGNYFVGVAFGHAPLNLKFALGQRIVRMVFGHFNGDFGRNPSAAAMHASKGLDQLFSEHAFRQVPGSAGFECPD